MQNQCKIWMASAPRMSFRNLGLTNCEYHAPRVQEKSSGCRRMTREDKPPNVDRKTDCIYVPRFLQDQRYSGESLKHERLAQYRIVQRQPQEVRFSEETMMTPGGGIFLGGLCHRRVEKSTPMHNALAQHLSDQTHREERKIDSYGHRRFGGPPAEFSYVSKGKKGRVNDRAIQVSLVKHKGDGNRGACKQWLLKGSGATCALDDDQISRQGKNAADAKSDKKDSLLQKTEVCTRTGTSPSGKEERPPCYSYKQGNCFSQSTIATIV